MKQRRHPYRCALATAKVGTAPFGHCAKQAHHRQCTSSQGVSLSPNNEIFHIKTSMRPSDVQSSLKDNAMDER